MGDDYFFGCGMNEKGHYLFDTNGRRLNDHNIGAYGNVMLDFPIRINCLDGGLLAYDNTRQVEGRAIVSHIRGWTIVSFWDRSVDTRRNSNANFIMRGTFDFEAALERIKAVWPTIFARFTFPIVECKTELKGSDQ